jgi:hypothetical protein
MNQTVSNIKLSDKVRVLNLTKTQKDRYFNGLMEYSVQEIIKMDREPWEVLEEAIIAIDMEFRFRGWEGAQEYTKKIDKFLRNQRFKVADAITKELYPPL